MLKKIALSSFLVALHAFSAKANSRDPNVFSLISIGGISSGGGDALVCGDNLQSPDKVELLDLYEGQIRGEVHLPANMPMEEALTLAQQRLESTGYGFAQHGKFTISDRVEHILETIQIRYDTEPLSDLEDSFHSVPLPRGCQIQQIALFLDRDTILVDGSLWDKLPDLHKAALIIHEAIYWHFREQVEIQDSRRTREIISKIFARSWSNQSINVNNHQESLICEAFESDSDSKKSSSFFIENSNTDLVLRFYVLAGIPLMTEGQAAFSDLTLEKLGWNGLGFDPQQELRRDTILNSSSSDPSATLILRTAAVESSSKALKIVLAGQFGGHLDFEFLLQSISCHPFNQNILFPPGPPVLAEQPPPLLLTPRR